MNDFRLKVFRSLTTNLRFTKAASIFLLLNQRLSNISRNWSLWYSTRPFKRLRSVILLTAFGEILLKYTHQILSIYREAFFGISPFQDSQ